MALFWKVLFFLTLLSVPFGLAGVLATPGVDQILNLLSALQSLLYWQFCARGRHSVRLSRFMETSGLVIMMVLGGASGRLMLASFVNGESIVTADGAAMADGFVSMMLIAGTTMLVAIRAALIPSSPRRTVLLTTLLGAPVVLVPALFVPTADGWITWRTPESLDVLWAAHATMWAFTVVTCATISRVIYGLRAEVREARRLGQYTLEEKLGEGGMGEVYRARHGMMRRPTAIKLLRADHTGETDLARFEREVQLTARLTHPNTITIFDYGRTVDDVFYYAMELLEGATLREVVEVDGPQPPARVARILTMACGALAEAHAIGLIHRDIKPANIMLCRQGGELDVAKVLDFGLVKELDRNTKLTGTNTLTGTPQYIAPESILDPDTVDERTDIYALGAVAYYLLCGAPVFDGKSVVEVCSQHLHKEPVAISARGVTVPAKLEQLVLECLNKDPADRPQHAGELRALIEGCHLPRWGASDSEQWWHEHQAELDASRGDTEADSADRSVALTVGRRDQGAAPD
ncbi:MAG: serine/threonine-protein kinase [Polyangiales bacterium]